VEAKEGESNYDQAVPEFQQAVRYAAGQSNIPFISLKVTGFARFTLLEKMQQSGQLSAAELREFDRVRQRVQAICATAEACGVSVLIDAEQSWIQQPVDRLTEEVMERFNQSRVVVYNTYQMYRRDRLEYLKETLERSRQQGYLLGAKLVRGAYMEKERERAAQLGYPDPIQPDKAATDRDYDEAVRLVCRNLDRTALFAGTHNQESCRLAAQLVHEAGLPHDHPHVHFSQLYGMSDPLTFNLAKAGFRVSKYLPYGPVTDVLPYLIRRAEENSSVSGQMSRELRLIHQEVLRRRAAHGA
jgi:proline dehydrogenase